jgi:ATP sulfurylase
MKKCLLKNAKERVKLASKIQQRKQCEMREEERIVVYRRMIQDMLTNGISMPDDRTRHVVAELINSIFDVNKMLYFVAPECAS